MRTCKNRSLLILVAALCLLGWHAPRAWAHDEDASAQPTLSAIDAAQARGEISQPEAVLYKLRFVRGAGGIPKALNPAGERIKCGTPIVLEAMQQVDAFPEPYRSEAKSLLMRPTLDSYLDTAHFRIHYSTSGSNMIYNWPDTGYRDSVASACEKSYAFYVANGWQVPPSDGGSGGNGLIDCYVDDVGTGVYGVTYAESTVPGGYPNERTAYFIIDHAYDGFGYTDRTLPMKVTVAHEYHHVVQMGYTYVNVWWMENTSTFMEDEVYDSINDNYNYLTCYMGKPYLSQSTYDGCFEYGAFLWPSFLKEKWAQSVVRDIWLCTAPGSGVFTCFNSVLAGEGSSHESALKEWIDWNFYTAARAYGSHYIEAASYPASAYLSYDKLYTNYPQVDQHPSGSRVPAATGASVMRLKRDTASADNLMTVSYSGPSCTSQVLVISKLAGQVVFQESYMNLSSGAGTLDIHDWNTMEYAYLIVSMSPNCAAGTFDYAFSAVTSQATGVDPHPPLYVRTVDLEQNWPNPFSSSTEISYRLPSAAPVVLGVYDAAGRQIRSLVRSSQPAGAYTVSWDGRDDAGSRVPHGAYFCRLHAAGAASVRKMILAP
jgi:hypothetical protein